MRTVIVIPLKRVTLSSSRPTVPETVNAMAQSLRDLGLINPITVRPTKVYDGAIFVPGYQVVAGNHRVAAARALGWEEIEAFEIPDDDRIDHELREIDENLCRAELTPAQRSYALLRRKELWEMRQAESGTICSTLGDPKTGRGNTQFASDTSQSTGHTKQDINRHISRAEALGEDLLDVAGTSLDKGVELDALKAMPEPERKELIQRAKAGEKVTARIAQAASPEPASEKTARVMRALEALADLPGDMKAGEFAQSLSEDLGLKASTKALMGIDVALALRSVLIRAPRKVA